MPAVFLGYTIPAPHGTVRLICNEKTGAPPTLAFIEEMRDCARILKHIGELIMPTKKTVKETKNVLIISASFRSNSNSHALCQEVAKGVKAAGNKAEVVRLKDKKIGFCTGCYACQKLG